MQSLRVASGLGRLRLERSVHHRKTNRKMVCKERASPLSSAVVSTWIATGRTRRATRARRSKDQTAASFGKVDRLHGAVISLYLLSGEYGNGMFRAITVPAVAYMAAQGARGALCWTNTSLDGSIFG